MLPLIIVIFAIGYLAIVLEHPIKLNKTSSALLTGVLLWTVFAVFNPPASVLSSPGFLEFQKTHATLSGHSLYIEFVGHSLGHHLTSIAEIIFFLMGAMTIVELIDAHNGFDLVTRRIKTNDSRKLLWIISIITFILSAILDNLTASIVMVSFLRKLVPDPDKRKLFAGVVIIAANAGGAWSPIGDVTTTMLWIGGQVSAGNIMKTLILPSIVCLVVPLLWLTFRMKGKLNPEENAEQPKRVQGSIVMLITGILVLLFVPVFKTVTHLPPYLGMLLGLGIVWLVSEIVHSGRDEEEKQPYTAVHALSRIDMPSMLFFVGILLAISCLESTHLLNHLAEWMQHSIGNMDLVVIAIGVASAVVDNVPLVAATMGMYDLAQYPIDSRLWEFIAYSAGTGGSILIIGSAAGVAVMGMEKIDFIWYLRRIGWLAFLGFLAGALTYVIVYPIFSVY